MPLAEFLGENPAGRTDEKSQKAKVKSQKLTWLLTFTFKI
jgi:hypothetical protein